MFNWNVEAMELRKQAVVMINNKPHFSAEGTTSREDMIEFVDRMTDGKLSYIIDVMEKFAKESENLPKDRWGTVKTVSLKAWLKRNDPQRMVDQDYKYGKFNLLGSERYISEGLQHQGPWDYYKDIVQEAFYRQLLVCKRKEDAYFAEHDPHTIALNRVRDYFDAYRTTFGIRIGFSSKDIVVDCRNENSRYSPQLTLDQCNFFIKKYEELERTIAQLSENAEADFDQV